MANPYWGQLPPPKITRSNSIKQDEGQVRRGDNDLSIDTNNRMSYPSRQNRQSTRSDAPTASTQSPFASPLASEFRGEGLAPRPSSFQYAPDNSRDFLEKRRRRESRNKDRIYDEPPSVTPPAAPDVPRAPPISYKQPYGNGPPTAPDVPRAPPISYKQPYSNGSPISSSQPPTRSRSSKKSEGPVTLAKTSQENNYRTQPRGEYPPIDQDTIRPRTSGKAPIQTVNSQRARPEHIDIPEAQPRKGSLAESEAERRRDWAPDRSPLQRLESTLDSITKEEKRARVEEAEIVAREEKAGRGGERATQNSVRFRNRPVAKAPDGSSRAQPQNLPEAGLVRNLSTKQKGQLQRSGTVEKARPAQVETSPSTKLGRGFDYEPQLRKENIQKPSDTGTESAPQRKTSTRDRSNIPVAATLAAAGVAGVGRSGSNKLKKNPPDDPWYHKRIEAEERYPAVSKRTANPSERSQPMTSPTGPSRDTAFRSHPQPSKDKELPVLPLEATGVEQSDSDSDEEIDKGPARRATLNKLERLTGEIVPNKPSKAAQKGKEVRTEVVTVNGVGYAIQPGPVDEKPQSNVVSDTSKGHRHLDRILHRHKNGDSNQGVYTASRRLDEWKKGGVALLSGALLDLDLSEKTEAEKDKAWWEAGNTGRRRSSTSKRKAEAYDGEYDDSTAPTRFKPKLFLKSGPMLRYCGIRRETPRSRSTRTAALPEREIWRGSIMIVTQDVHSSYELAPTLRLFLQPTELLPPPPAHVDGEELAPEYVDPIASLSKIGRDGRTLYVRPVENLDEEKDLSREESDEGLFEMQRTPLDGAGDHKPANRKSHYDGEKAGKYKEVRGLRLHAEQGVTFWRFNIEIELREKQQRIAYRINRGPATGFWVPARGHAMNIMFSSCNGFSHDIDPNEHCGPDPMWRDVLNTHQTQPFHVMLGGGDQLYNDIVMEEATLFREWSDTKDLHHKENSPFTAELQNELEAFYLSRYCMWFSQGLFSLAVSQIPMINIFDDHDIIDGFGSYPDRYMRSPVFSGLGNVAFKYYMLFQHQTSIDEGEETEPSWILGTQPGPYIKELSRSIFTSLGGSVAFLGLDCRTERMNDEIVSAETYHKVFTKLRQEIAKGQTKHLIVLVGIPVAYPRMVWLENILTSRALLPVKVLGRAGLLGKGLLNHMDGGVEILDDLDDHWTARHHKDERNWFIQELQDLAAEKSVRVTILGGDVHLAAIGQFYSNPKLKIPKDRDFRYMPNIISSAIVNAPPPDTVADLLNKRNKVHHLDGDTDEDMIPIFTHDSNGKPRNNKRMLNRRNWCSIRLYDPELSPPSTPQTDSSPSPPPTRGGLLRRLSSSRGPTYRPDATPPLSSQGFFGRRPSNDGRPPLANPGGFFSRRESTSRSSMDSERPGVITRTLSLTRKDFLPGGLFRRNSKKRTDNGGINGYDSDSEDDVSHYENEGPGIRGGSGGPEDDGYFPQMPPPKGRTAENLAEEASTSRTNAIPQHGSTRTKFHRTPTGLSEKKRRAGAHEIDLEGGLDICLNVEVSSKDPAGITMPYRLLVPALWYNDDDQSDIGSQHVSGVKRWTSFKKKG